MRDDYYIGGIHAVESAISAGRPISKIFISSEVNRGRVKELTQKAKNEGVLIVKADPRRLNEMLPDIRHQGVVALASPVTFKSIDEMLDLAKSKNEDPFLVIAEGVEDPRNLGAIIRSAECFGVHGVIIPRRSSSPVTSVVAKTAAGALERVWIAQVGNISQELEKLKRAGVWIAGMALENSREMSKENLTGPIALVLGNEGKGISRLVAEKCDYLVHIPMRGEVGSLNVSVAAGIGLYEIQKQR